MRRRIGFAGARVRRAPIAGKDLFDAATIVDDRVNDKCRIDHWPRRVRILR